MSVVFRFSRFLARAASNARIAYHRTCGVVIGRDCLIEPDCDLAPGHDPLARGELVIRAGCTLSRGVVLARFGGTIRLGERTFLGPYTVVYGHGGVEIGDDTLVSMHCRILSSNHSIPPADRRIRWEPDLPRPTKIGHDVWLGAGVTVLGGVTIGEGSVVGAGAVVAHDLPPYSVAVGVPAKVIRRRPSRE